MDVKDQSLEDGVSAIDGDGPYCLSQPCQLVSPGIPLTDVRATRRLGDALRLAGWEKRRDAHGYRLTLLVAQGRLTGGFCSP